MAKAKISSKDFLDLLDEQSDQPAPVLGSLIRGKGGTPNATAAPIYTSTASANGSLNRSPNGKQTVVNGSLNRSPNGKQTVVNSTPSELGEIAKRESNGSPNGSHGSVRNGSQTVVQTVVQKSLSTESLTDKIMRLGAIESRILFCVVESCVSRGQLVSNPLKPDFLARAAGSTKKTTKSCAQRLVKKNLLARAGGQDGKGGWTLFSVSEATRNAVLGIWKNSANGSQTVVQTVVTAQGVTVVKQESKRESELSSSSSFLDLETLKTTTGESELFDDGRVQLSPDWSALDTSPLAEIGFTQTHLVQLAKHGKLSTAEVQDSIHFFAFDLKRNGKGRELKGPPVNFFMGILRKGQPYAPPANYESPEETARREYLEGKRRLEERRQTEERELQDLDFAEWRRGISPEEVNAIVPEVVRHVPRACEASLRAYFDENVWPARRVAIPGAVDAERAEIARQVEQSLGEARG